MRLAVSLAALALPVPAAAAPAAAGLAARHRGRGDVPDLRHHARAVGLARRPSASASLIRRLIAAGQDQGEIKDALVAEYGEDVLAVPDSEASS